MKILDDTQLLNLTVEDKRVLQDISISVRLDNNSKVNLPLVDTKKRIVEDEKAGGNFTELLHTFTKEGDISFVLRFRFVNDIIFAYVDTLIVNERMQSRHRYFAPESGIEIKVKGLGHIEGLMANYQHKDWWTRPHFSTNLSTLPDRTQSLLWKANGSYYHLLPVVDEVYRTELVGNEDGFTIKISSYTGGFDRCQTFAFAIGKGNSPFELAKQTIEKTVKELGSPTLVREDKRYPETLEYLGWCSWDAFYHQVSEKNIIEKMNELKDKELPVKWVMIDDGWLDIKDNRLHSFGADKGKFPNGLSSISEKLKQQFGVSNVGVWHTIAGYWGGIHEDLAKTLGDSTYRTNSQKYVPHPDASKGFEFWNKWHSELKKQGIDFVKVDSQSAINNFMMYQQSIGEAARGAHSALEASVGIHFDQCIINCMGMAAENIFNRPISSVSRNSDDFVPGEEISFKEHALQNSYNSFYHGELYWGDWDMFWTNHEEDIQNAVLRALSGGPIYFSDRVGETDSSKIWPLIQKDGRILRADQPGLPTEDCLFINPNIEEKPLKIWNTKNGVGVIGAFNINVEGKTVTGTVSPSDIPGLTGEKFAVLDYFNKNVKLLSKNDQLTLSLEKEGVAFYNIMPFQNVAPIGLINKYLAPGTVSASNFYENKLVVSTIEAGTFGFVSDKHPKEAYVNKENVAIRSITDVFYTIDCPNQHEGEQLIEILFD